MKKMLRFVLILIVALGAAGGAGVWKVRQLANSKILVKDETIFTLKAGTGRQALGEQLYGDKIINRPRVFQWLLRVEPELSHFKAGTYRFTPGMTVREMLQLLESGKEAQFPLRFVEGMRLSDYLKQLRDAPYIKHTLKDDSYQTVDVHGRHDRCGYPEAGAQKNGCRRRCRLGRADGRIALQRSEPVRDHGLDHRERDCRRC